MTEPRKWNKVNKAGTGSTADAIRYEKMTGIPVNGTWHDKDKGPQMISALQKWIDKAKKDPNIDPNDLKSAIEVIKDLRKAMAE